MINLQLNIYDTTRFYEFCCETIQKKRAKNIFCVCEGLNFRIFCILIDCLVFLLKCKTADLLK